MIFTRLMDRSREQDNRRVMRECVAADRLVDVLALNEHTDVIKQRNAEDEAGARMADNDHDGME